MKAIRVSKFGDPEVMKLEEISDLIPGEDQVLIEVRAAGVNPVDTYIRSGAYAIKPDLPYTPGIDASGLIKAVGAEVQNFKPGDRVYTSPTISGSYAEKATCNQAQVHLLPDNTSFSQGAALGVPYGTAYRALFHRAKATAGQAVLVHGASGSVGTAAVQLAKAAGLKVVGSAGIQKGMELVKEQGADYVVSHKDDKRFDKIMDWTEGRGVDIVLEMLANENLNKDLEIMALKGRVVVIGCRGDININPRLTMVKDSSVIGMLLMNTTIEELQEIHKQIYKGLQSGDLNPVVAQELALSQAPKAHHQIIESSSCGKIVLIP
ncbi:MAG: NADPH:quinone reductase [Planctomycetota bacterium]|jgi:NADPH2:quinone reductase